MVYNVPLRARVVCDETQIYPTDPGQGTPTMVYWGKLSGTFNCCVNEGEIDGQPLPEEVVSWLRDIEELVDDWLTGQYKLIGKSV